VGERGGLADRALAAGRRVFPELALASETLSDYLSHRLSSENVAVSDEILADLYLACAGLAQTPGAIEVFTRAHLSRVHLLTRSYDRSLAFADEVAQLVRTKLFVGEDDGPPKIAQYRGDGPLGAWVKVVVVRVAQRLASGRERDERSVDETLTEALTSSNDGEVLLLRAELREAFKSAFRQAVRELPQRFRLVLRLNVVRRVSTTAIAKLNNVDQSTVSRWIIEARGMLRLATHKALAESLKLSQAEVESVLTSIDSKVEINLSQLLATGGSSIGGGSG
jgi:RNA polymerase sigma-70 factor (ECF subfamily)